MIPIAGSNQVQYKRTVKDTSLCSALVVIPVDWKNWGH